MRASCALDSRLPIIRAMPTRRHCLTRLVAAAAPLAIGGRLAHASTLPGPTVIDDLWTDAARQRTVPVRLRWPDANRHAGPWPVVIFSHGLGGTRDGGAVWAEAWVAAGFAVVQLQHPGSDLDAVGAVAASFRDQAALRSLTGPEQLMGRLRDIGFALDEISRRHTAAEGWWSRVRPTGVGLAGHSFGAHTTLGMAGQRYPAFDGIDEPRLAAFIAFSPTVPRLGSAHRAFERLTRPVLSITGTRDGDVVGVGATPERRMAVFGALPPGHKAQLVLQDADHMTFAGQTGRAVEIVPREPITRDLQATHHALVASLTADWWRATLMDDAAAWQRLASPPGLASGDRWQRK